MNKDTIYIGTTDWIEGGGVYQSIDGGDSWSHIGLYDFYVFALALNSNGQLFAGTWGNNMDPNITGVYLFDDTSGEWEHLLTKYVNDLLINSDDEIFVACGFPGSGVYYSEDNGQNFVALDEGMFEGIDVSYFDDLGGMGFYQEFEVVNNDQYLASLSIDWTILEHQLPPIRGKGFRLYCDYHESTKICEMELFCSVENIDSALGAQLIFYTLPMVIIGGQQKILKETSACKVS